MFEAIDKPRYVCALGAFHTLLAIDRAVPILHAGQGCGGKLSDMLGDLNGSQGSGYINAHILPCTNVSEKEVVFGGSEKLYETIENTLKVYDADFFAVFSGCTAEIVGDDIAEVVSRFTGANKPNKPVVYVETAGFKGSNLIGHEYLWDAIFSQYLKPTNVINPRQVNVFSSVPYHNPFWYGDLKEIERLLSRIGLEPNIIYGPANGLGAIDRIPQARLNILASPWVSLGNVKLAEERFGTPYYHYPSLPVGPTDTASFLCGVAENAGVAKSVVDAVIAEEETEYYYLLGRASDELIKTRHLPGHFSVIADSLYAISFTKFLVNDMGMIPDVQFITDGPPEGFREQIIREFNELEIDLPVDVKFVSGSGEAQRILKSREYTEKPYIIGSGWEKTFSQEFGTLSLSASTPLLDRLIINRTYAGYRGALTLLEDICTSVFGSYL